MPVKSYSIDILIQESIDSIISKIQVAQQEKPALIDEFVCPEIPKEFSWWNRQFPFRQIIKIKTTPYGLRMGHPIRFKIDLNNLQNKNKLRLDKTDYRVVHEGKAIPSNVITINNDSYLSYPCQRSVKGGCEDRYMFYYGSGTKIAPSSYTEERWPIFYNYNNPVFNYVKSESNWNLATPNITQEGSAIINLYADSTKIVFGTGPDYSEVIVGKSLHNLFSDNISTKEILFDNLDVAKSTRIPIRVGGKRSHLDPRLAIMGAYVRALPITIGTGEELLFKTHRIVQGL